MFHKLLNILFWDSLENEIWAEHQHLFTNSDNNHYDVSKTDLDTEQIN